MRRTAPWVGLAAGIAALGWALGAAGLPSPALFGALLGGLAVALVAPGRFAMPRGPFTVGQAMVGVTLGAYLQASSLRILGDDWLPVALVSLGTLVISIVAGLVLARTTVLDRPTAVLGMIAGGASGIVTMADDLGGDDRLVAFMQYLRVLVVVLLTPVLVALLFDAGGSAGGVAPSVPLVGDGRDWVVSLALAGVGAAIARQVALPAGTVLVPMILAGAVTLSTPDGWFTVPDLLQQPAYALIGLQVGLRFTLATVRLVGRLIVPVLASVVAIMVACFGLAVALDAVTAVSLQDAYLATTPGGIFAVVTTAFGANADTTFIVAVQALRVIVMVLLAPLVVRWLIRRPVRA